MSIVSNTSPLINLACISKLSLLSELYGELCIPEAVWHEVVVKGAGQPGADEVKAAGWIKINVVENKDLVLGLRQELDSGEAEAIVLALEKKSDLLLMDERLGRETARHLGLNYTGVVGVLIEAKRRGLISSVKFSLDTLRNTAGFRISDALYKQVLQDEGEP